MSSFDEFISALNLLDFNPYQTVMYSVQECFQIHLDSYTILPIIPNIRSNACLKLVLREHQLSCNPYC